MKKGAILRRPMPEFGMEFAWYGTSRVVVESNGQEVYDLPLRSPGPKTASQAMDQERDRLHASCQAFS